MDQNDGFILKVFSDYVVPWCYFITGRVARLKEDYEIGIRWIAFPLHPETPEEGRTSMSFSRDGKEIALHP